jgi:hypothetical protein
MEFFVSAYHLRDALVKDHVAGRDQVERAISDSPTLSLLADLANLEKHRILERPPRSGEIPRMSLSDVADKSGWRLRVVIAHKGQERDDVEFAREVIGEWARVLNSLGQTD